MLCCVIDPEQDFAPKFLRLFLNILAAANSGVYQSPRVANAMLQYCTLGYVPPLPTFETRVSKKP